MGLENQRIHHFRHSQLCRFEPSWSCLEQRSFSFNVCPITHTQIIVLYVLSKALHTVFGEVRQHCLPNNKYHPVQIAKEWLRECWLCCHWSWCRLCLLGLGLCTVWSVSLQTRHVLRLSLRFRSTSSLFNTILWVMNIVFNKYPLEFSFSIDEWLSDITAWIPQVVGKSFSLTFCCP